MGMKEDVWTPGRMVEILANIKQIVECDNIRPEEKVEEVKRELRRAKIN